jgi:hypothetical protein
MEIIPITKKIADNFIQNYHRHNKPVIGFKFAIGLRHNEQLIGVGIAGRPVARALDNGFTIEILRVCVKEGYPNANSKLYGRLVRIAKLMGYNSVITYTLSSESQSSIKAVGGKKISYTKPHQWDCKSRHRTHEDIYNKSKIRW